MSTHSPSSLSTTTATVPAWRQWIRRLYFLVAGLVCLCIVAQVFFAGAAVLVEPTYWIAHRSLGNTIESVVLALLLIGVATRLPWRIQALGGFLFVLMILQYIFLYLMPRLGVPLLRSLHAVNALVLFSIALMLMLQVWQKLRE